MKKWLRKALMVAGAGLAAASQVVEQMPGWIGVAGAFLAGLAKHVPGVLDERK